MTTTKQHPPLRVIGDVHGHPETLLKAAGDASQILLLGDLVDRGPDSPRALRIGIEWIEQGRAKWVRANHEDKLFRHFKGNNVKIGKHLQDTLTAFDALPDRANLIERFMTAYANAPFVHEHGNYVFAHGAVSASFFNDDINKAAKHMALYGETDGTFTQSGKPTRLYNWADEIPKGRTVIVGHDRRDGANILTHTNKLGGKSIFLDTGCGKGGPLSFIDLPHETTGQVHP